MSLAELKIKRGRLNSADSVHVCNEPTAIEVFSRLTPIGSKKIERFRGRYEILLASSPAFGWRHRKRSAVVCRRPQLQVIKRPVVKTSFYFCIFPGIGDGDKFFG